MVESETLLLHAGDEVVVKRAGGTITCLVVEDDLLVKKWVFPQDEVAGKYLSLKVGHEDKR